MNRKIALGMVFGLVASGSLCVAAEPSPVQPTVTGIDPVAARVLRTMGGYLQHAERFRFRVDEVSDRIEDNGARTQYEVYSDVAVHRPNRLRADSRGDAGREAIFYDGHSLTVMDFQTMDYRRSVVPDSIDAALDYAAQKLGLTAPLEDLVYSDPYKVLIENVQQGEYLGVQQVRGQSAHHLRFTQQTIDWQIWVADNWEPVPLKVVISYKSEPGQPQFIAWLSDWNFSPYLPDSLFDFAAPPGAVESPAQVPASGLE